MSGLVHAIAEHRKEHGGEFPATVAIEARNMSTAAMVKDLATNLAVGVKLNIQMRGGKTISIERTARDKFKTTIAKPLAGSI